VLKEVVCREDLNTTLPTDDVANTYFGWECSHNSQRLIREEALDPVDDDDDEVPMSPKSQHRKNVTNVYLQSGWLDGVGIFKDGVGASARLAVWETESEVQAFDHLPLRAVVTIDSADKQHRYEGNVDTKCDSQCMVNIDPDAAKSTS